MAHPTYSLVRTSNKISGRNLYQHIPDRCDTSPQWDRPTAQRRLLVEGVILSGSSQRPLGANSGHSLSAMWSPVKSTRSAFHEFAACGYCAGTSDQKRARRTDPSGRAGAARRRLERLFRARLRGAGRKREETGRRGPRRHAREPCSDTASNRGDRHGSPGRSERNPNRRTRGAQTPSFLCRRASLVLKWPTNQSATVAERDSEKLASASSMMSRISSSRLSCSAL